MGDSPDTPTTIPCPTCGEESSDGSPCELCLQEADALKLAENAKRLAQATAEKYPPLKPFNEMGYDA